MRHMLSALALALPLPALAQDPATVGTMSGVLDGIQVSYVIVDEAGAETAWTQTDEGIGVLITAYPSDSPMDDANKVTLMFTGDTTSRDPQMLRGTMTMNRGEETLTATDGALNVDLDSLEVSGDSLLFIGAVHATLGEGPQDLTIVDPQGTNLSANVQATIIRNDDADGAFDQ